MTRRAGTCRRGAKTGAGAVGLALGLVASVVCPASARPLDKVQQSGVLVVAVYRDFAPWAFEKDGAVEGVDVEIGKMLAASLGVRAEFMVRMAGEDVDGDLRANVWRGDIVNRKMADVMMHVPVDQGLALRNDQAVICCRYTEERMAIAYDPSVITTKSFAVFRSRRVAVEAQSTGDMWMSAAFGGLLGANIDRGRTFEAAAEIFVSGKDPALVAPRAQLEWAARGATRPVAIEEWPMLGVVKSSWPIGLAVRFDSRDLGHALDGALEAAKADGRLDAAFARWGVTRSDPKD